MSTDSHSAHWEGFFPDGLDEPTIDRLIAEAELDVVHIPAPTSALVDGSAAERRRRRIERRMLAAVVRSLPSRRRSRPAGEVA